MCGRVLKVRLEEMREKNMQESCASIKRCIVTVAKQAGTDLCGTASVPAQEAGKVEALIAK